jgi:predicted  nucleic acid-binding Zn-ribbon protein
MSESEQYEMVTVASDGVTVDKRFEEDEFPVPAIAFEIQSSRSETVTVTLVDRVPEDVAVEDLGFHPEYGSEYWTIDEDQITFEREIEANSEYTTVYGIRATGTEDVEQFLTEPTVTSVDPPPEEGAAAVVDDAGSDVVRDVIAGESDAVPGLEDDEDEDVETLNLKDPNEPDDAGGSGESGGGDSASATGGSEVDSLVGALAAELRNGSVDEDDVVLLRKAFDVVSEDSSVDARIQRLQTEVADLLAYTDALEEFLDENGTAEQTIEEFRSEVETLQSDLDAVRSLARSHEESLSTIESTVDGVESSMESLESEMDEVLSDVETVQSEVEEVGSSVDDVESSVDEVEEDLADLESQVGDIDVSDIEGDIDDIEGDIEELKEWREQLSSVIGGD